MNHEVKRLSCSGMALLASVCANVTASGAWPQNPGSPMVLGDVLGVGFFEDHATASTPDGATWVAWMDQECLGSLHVQRISADGSLLMPEGLTLFPTNGCVLRRARLAACVDSSVVISAVGGSETAVQRLTPSGTALWRTDVVASKGWTVGQLLGP